MTTGLLDRLDDRELAAVIAHELAHIMHRDALVMTVVAGPAVTLLAGLRSVRSRNWRVFVFMGVMPYLLLAELGTRLLSRQREYAADRGAALILGSGAAVAAVLQKLAGTPLPVTDLRAVAARDVLHIMPLEEPRRLKRLRATHPPLERRIAALMEIEARLQS